MALGDLWVADSDMHVMEPADLWQRYMDPAWEHAAPVGHDRDRARHAGQGQERRPAPPGPHAPAGSRPPVEARAGLGRSCHAEERNWDAKSQVMAMDIEHLDSTVLFPSRGLFVLSLQSTEHIGARRPRAGPRRGHRPRLQRLDGRLRRASARRPSSVFGAAMLAPHDVGAAVDELARNVERGFKAAFLVPGLVDNKPWHDPQVRPALARGRAPRRARSASTAAARPT